MVFTMRIVIKIGTSTLAHHTGRLNIRRTEVLCKVISDLKNAGHEIVMVSSGAIGMGAGKLSLKERPSDMPTKQAAAAVGQCELMYTYDKLFGEYNHTVAQILLTSEDIEHDDRRQNVENTMERLLSLGAIPIINENDTISTSEIVIGDNDTLSAIVASTVHADLLVLLSDIDGLFTADPRKDPSATLIPTVCEITPEIKAMTSGAGTNLGTGGMTTKIQAAQIATENGIDMVIANGADPVILYDIADGKQAGTRFLAQKKNALKERTKRIMKETKCILQEAKAAVSSLAVLKSEEKNKALLAMADALIADTSSILCENKKDMDAAKDTISSVMLDRLKLDESRIRAMADGIRAVAALPDPVGRILSDETRPNGLHIQKISVPMGVIAIIYESRPNVTSDAAALALKSGNVCVLRTGKEAFHSAFSIVTALKKGLHSCGINEQVINLIEDTSRKSALDLMRAVGFIDLLIPRGGAGLIKACVEQALVPCIQTGTGICHIYVDKDADLSMALRIVENAKMSRPSVCNAAEVCLVHRDVAKKFLPMLQKSLCDQSREHPAKLLLDKEALSIIDGTPADENDFDTEFLDYILAVHVVSDVNEAIAHIASHSTHHSESIITQNEQTAALFTTLVDSAAVYVNASTRFTDGGEFGLGCEMGISTQKLHARGPMGLRELTAYKYVITGNGQTR